jgi:hypothetical protein
MGLDWGKPQEERDSGDDADSGARNARAVFGTAY